MLYIPHALLVISTISMEMEAAAEVIAYIFAVVAATSGLILAWHCCPRWRIRLVWTGGTPRLYKYKWRGGFRRGSLDNSSDAQEEEKAGVTDKDLKVLLAYIDEKDGGPPWHLMIDRSTSTLLFRAWRRDPKYGPTQYRSQTIFENKEPELLRDFFWDDEFRTKWDDMVVYFKTLQEYPYTGTVITHWIRKFPFFCSHREYIIGRRLWVSGSTYYCVSKSIPFPDIPRRQRPRRVDLYYSSWCIREVESRNGGTASEVLLFHYEDMGIQKMLAKAGVQRGMWKLVQKLEQGVHAYQVSRQNGAPPSRYALLARIATPVSDTDILRDETCLSEDQFKEEEEDKICGFVLRRKMLKWLLAGGILMSWGMKHEELNKGSLSHIIQHIRNIHSSKEYRKVCFITENKEIAKQSQELRSASKPLEELIQKAISAASRQVEVLREQSPVSELLAWTERVSRPHSRWRASWPHLLMAAMKIFGW